MDDTADFEADDQRSQQDIYSNGFDEENRPVADDGAGDAARLQHASDASEASFTLNTDDVPPVA